MTIRPSRRLLEPVGVCLVALILACAMTYPVIARIGRVGRSDTADGRLSIWNVAWVARTLVVDPVHLFDANIFFPHRGTLAYSENNFGAGVLALPAYWATGGNPYAALNVALLLAFSLSFVGTYYLVRHLTDDRRAAVVSAILFAFCPHVFAHTAHIQLLMTAGLPFSMLAFHRLADRPTASRGAQLGLAMAAQAASCGYYGVFLLLIVGFAVIVVAVSGPWRRWAYWRAIAIGAVVAVLLVAPLFWPYLALQRDTGFGRGIDDARRYSADWRSYLASSAYAHSWMLKSLGRWNEVLFPGVLATGLGAAGVWLIRRRRSDLLVIYGGLTALAFWTSFGPKAGLYTALYDVVPLFTWLRAPSRFGLVVAFGLSVLSGLGLAVLLPKNRRGSILALVIAAVAVAELAQPFPVVSAPALSPAYNILASMPRGPVIEMPFFFPEVGLFQHTIYMLSSTSHWMPLVNGYSDYIPPDFRVHVETLKFFPSRDAFKLLQIDGARYAVLHMYRYNAANRADVVGRLKEFEHYLRPLYVDDETRLYEIIGFPP
ncbi:MAG: hypothetical protein ABJA98_16470 [Acidobacteriota bacterium]